MQDGEAALPGLSEQRIVARAGDGVDRAQDLYIGAGTIASIGEAPPGWSADRTIDATGMIVAPGFIESHTHYDGTMWWQPDLDPLPGYGATTMIMGNCGFSPAPLHKYMPAQREMIGIFSFFEDIPEGPFMQNLPWDWNKWSEYRA